MGFRVMRVISHSTANAEPVAQSTSGTTSTSTPQDEKKLAPLPESGFDEAKNEQLNGRLKIVSQVHGANEAQLKRWAASLPDSHRPYWISVRSAGKDILFDGLARKAPSRVEWKLEIIDGDDKDQYHKVVKGFRPAIVNAYKQDGVLKRQLVLWRGDPGWLYWYGSREHIERKIKEGFSKVKTDVGDVQHLIPTHISAMSLNGGIQNELCQAFGPYTEGEFIHNVGMGTIGSMLLRNHNKGYRLHLFTGIWGSVEPRYNAVFVKKSKSDPTNWWSVSVRLTIAQYEEMLETIDRLGGWPRCVSSTIEDGRVIYSVLWDQIPQKRLQGITVLADPEAPRVKLRHD